MKNFIPYGRQNIDKKDIIEVTKSLKKNLITTGSYVKKFENEFSKYTDVDKYYAITIFRSISRNNDYGISF